MNAFSLRVSAHIPKQQLVQWMEEALKDFKQGDPKAWKDICCIGSLMIQKDIVEKDGIEAAEEDLDRTIKGRELLNPNRWKS